MVRVFNSSNLLWRGNTLYAAGKPIVSIMPDETWPGMWRIWHNGKLSDMVNITRARDAARSVALSSLNAWKGDQKASGALPVSFGR